MTWKDLLDFATDLPGVEQGTCYRTPALYVRKRILARLRDDGETVAIRIEFLDRDVLLQADPVAFFLTDHYRPYPMVVMRLKEAPPATARELLEQAWRRAAPKSLLAKRGLPGHAMAGAPRAVPGPKRRRGRRPGVR
jgi:hypothetical protein